MWGAIIGDIVGSRFEFNRNNIKTKAFGKLFDQKCRYTDDTVMTVGTADVNHITCDEGKTSDGN